MYRREIEELWTDYGAEIGGSNGEGKRRTAIIRYSYCEVLTFDKELDAPHQQKVV